MKEKKTRNWSFLSEEYEFINLINKFFAERFETYSVFEVINKGLEIFQQVPGGVYSSLFVFNRDTLEFDYFRAFPHEKEKEAKADFKFLIDDGAVTTALENGKISFHDLSDNSPEQSFMIIPLLIPSGVYGIAVICLNRSYLELEQVILQFLFLFANQLANYLHTARLSNDIKNLKKVVKQEVVSRTIDIEKRLLELKTILDNIEAGILIVDKDSGIIMSSNLSAQRIWGVNEDEIIGLRVKDYIFEYEARRSNEFINFGTYQKESVLRKKDGSHITIVKTDANIKLNDRNLLLISFIDISSKRKSEILSQRILDSLNDLVFQIDLTGNIQYVNCSVRSKLGFPDYELINRNISKIIHPEDFKRLHNKTSPKDLVFIGKSDLRFANKDRIYELFEVVGSPLYGDSGKVIGIALTARHADEKIKRIDKSELTEKHFSDLWEASFDAMRLVDEEGIILKVNEAFCKLVDIPRERLIGKSFTEIYKESARKEISENFRQRMFTHGIEHSLEREMTLWNGKKIWLQLSNSIVKIGDKNANLSIFRDITKTKQLAQELVEMNAQKDKFFSIIAHDLKSPFNGLLGCTNYLASKIDAMTKEEIKETFTTIHDSANYLFKLLDNLLTWSRMRTGRMEYDPSKTNIGEIIMQNIDLFANNAEQKEISLAANIKGEIFAFCDKKMINSVINNLISNAIKFTPRKGKVLVDAKRAGDSILIAVADSGIGMSKEKLSALFKIDANISTSGTENESGTGLGLILCKELVEKNYGKIHVESKENQGSIFTVTLKSHD